MECKIFHNALAGKQRLYITWKHQSVLQKKAENNIFIFLGSHSELLVCVLTKSLYFPPPPRHPTHRAVWSPFGTFGRCPPLQTHQVVCPILALHLGLAYPQGPFWAPVLGRTHPQDLFTVWWDQVLDPGHQMHLTACRARDKVTTLRTACILCTRYSVPAANKRLWFYSGNLKLSYYLWASSVHKSFNEVSVTQELT